MFSFMLKGYGGHDPDMEQPIDHINPAYFLI